METCVTGSFFKKLTPLDQRQPRIVMQLSFSQFERQLFSAVPVTVNRFLVILRANTREIVGQR